ncbi:MAG: AAA family ATPase, partial [Candidatus Methanomethylophilaceae archaeon]|nr:AAA family ATPase [Candidatus Methanomethylophilaceae archaeon]
MFIGREFELKTLNDLYNEDRFQFIPISGRRRVGKTRLIEEFAKGKDAIMFKAVPGNENVNLSMFNELVSGDTEPLRLDRILWRAEERSKGKRLIVVIDEYPNLVENAKHNGGLINNFIEAVKDTSKLFLILCGSSMSIMESEVLGKKSPLYGRRTGQIRLRPFDCETSRKMLAGFSLTDAISLFGLVGGIPYYLEQFDPNKTLEDNIRDRYINPTSVIAGEPELMFL